jgi:hypothetical protein
LHLDAGFQQFPYQIQKTFANQWPINFPDALAGETVKKFDKPSGLAYLRVRRI